MTDSWNDTQRADYHTETGCLSGDPYCARYPAPMGSYEAYRGELCGACEDQQTQDRRDRNTVPAGDADD